MIALHKGEIPFVVLLLPFIAGIGMGLWLYPVQQPVYPAIISSVLIIFFVALNVNYQKFKLYNRVKWLGAALVYSILLITGWLSTALHNELSSDRHFSRQPADYLLVQLNSEPKISGRYIRFIAVVKQNLSLQKSYASSGNLLLITPLTPLTKQLNYGDELLITKKYSPVTPPYNPAEFNYKQYLASQNIHFQEFVEPGLFKVINSNCGNPVVAYALRLRKRLAERLKTGIKDTSAAAVASTLMLGYKADLSNDILQAYTKTGTVHVLSVSGAHVAILYMLIVYALGFLGNGTAGRLTNLLLSVLLIWAYALLTGFSPAVCRAALMISLYITGKTLYRHISTLNILAASAFILLLYNPYLLADAGFQLSYLAVFGLLAFQPVVYGLFTVKNKWADKLWYFCSASIAAQLITFPLSIYYFHQFPVYFLISNLFIIIPTEVIMFAGLGYLLLYPVPYLSVLPEHILQYTIIFMNRGLMWIEGLSYASIGGLWITVGECVLLSLIIVLLVVFINRKSTACLSAALACLLILVVSAGFKKYKVVNSNEIVFFNLKKHSGILFRSGRKSLLLTDVAANDQVFNYSIKPCLDSSGVTNRTIINFNQDAGSSFCRKKGSYVQFLTKSILIIDSNFKFKPLRTPLHVNCLFVTGSSHPDLNLLSKSYVYSTVIANADNSNQAIEQLERYALLQQKKFVCLKRNKSFVLASN